MDSRDLKIGNSIIIPGSEIEVITSTSGGPGGQHANKTNTAVTIRWNVKNSNALSEIQKERIFSKLRSYLTSHDDLIIRSSSTRSQYKNKSAALAKLVNLIKASLKTPKKRIKTQIPKAEKEKRLQKKQQRSKIKRMRNIKRSI